MPTLNAVFKQVFGEALTPLGFVKIKSKYPYYVRVVEGGEIIHIISIRNEWSEELDKKAFNILGGVATVYRGRISLDKNPRDNTGWLRNVSCFYTMPTINFDRDFSKTISLFLYKPEDNKSMVNAVEHSLEITEKYMIPVLDKVNTLDLCIEYLNKFGLGLYLYGDGCFGGKSTNSFYNEGLLYIKTNHEIEKKWKKILDEKILDEESLQRVYQGYQYFGDPELNAKTLIELETRKKENTEILKSYGLNMI
ncbi:hypothetical protein FACS1894132_12560 [Clostridia bacterium]|nr:hypothetical protein FACS1894132_12560 [Clostridia bacterium]